MTSRDHPDNTHTNRLCVWGSFIQRLAHRGYLPHPSPTKAGLLEDSCQIMLLTNNIKKVYECTAAVSPERTVEHQNKLG